MRCCLFCFFSRKAPRCESPKVSALGLSLLLLDLLDLLDLLLLLEVLQEAPLQAATQQSALAAWRGAGPRRC